MTYIKLIVLIMFASLIACSNNSKNETPFKKDSLFAQSKANDIITDSNVYDDIDLFKIEGLKKIEHPLNYPYIKIEEINSNTKKVTYKRDTKYSEERIYTKNKEFWQTSYDFCLDSGCTRIYEFITPEKIIELDYNGTYEKTGFHLDDISVITKNKKISYSYWDVKGPEIKPDIKNLEALKNKSNVIITEEFNIVDGILTVISNSFDRRTNKKIDTDTICYKIGHHSWFWDQYFGWDNKVKCN